MLMLHVLFMGEGPELLTMPESGPQSRIPSSAVGEPLPKQVLDTAVDPDEIVRQSFDTERRGFDQRQVQAYLKAVAESLHDAQQRESEMRTRLGRAVRRAEAAEQAVRDMPTHDPAELDRQFADQVASVLEAARVAGEQRLAAAEKSAAEIMANAKTQATKMRAEAESVLRERRSEAELKVADILSEGQAAAQSVREQARAEGEAMLAEAADRVQRARDECDALIREAEEARAQILEDMERRRRQARAQVERLRVGRDRLLRSYEVVRRTLEETTVELKSSLNEAKVRGDGAARAITAEPLASRDQLEAELRDAKMIGRITISDPGPSASAASGSLRSPALPRPLTPAPDATAASEEPRRLRVSDAMKKGAVSKGALSSPKAPAVAPTLTASPVIDDAPAKDPIAAMIDAAEAKRAGTAAPVSPDLADGEGVSDESIDHELAMLEDDDLNVVEPSDEIEEVVALRPDDEAAPGLFAALRAQRSKKSKKQPETPVAEDPVAETPDAAEETAASEPAAEDEAVPAAGDEDAAAAATNSAELAAIPGLEAQRDAVIADAAKQLEKRLKRALADEQNELLAGIRASKRKKVELSRLVGNVDDHLNRYVLAIHEVAAVTYGAGAALVDQQAAEGHLPAGAVEELLETDVVMPIRAQLASLDDAPVDRPDAHVDPVRTFYRQQKTEHLGLAATRLANLLCVAGLCDALPTNATAPWVGDAPDAARSTQPA